MVTNPRSGATRSRILGIQEHEGRGLGDDDPLALDVEQMRQMGYAVVDLLVRRIDRLRDGPVLRTATRSEVEATIDEPAPATGRDFDGLLERLDRDVLPYVGHFDHPRFFGYIPGAGTWPAALGDLIAAATNIDSGSWRESAGPSQLELTRSEEHTSELQSQFHLVCRLLLEKKKTT